MRLFVCAKHVVESRIHGASLPSSLAITVQATFFRINQVAAIFRVKQPETDEPSSMGSAQAFRCG